MANVFYPKDPDIYDELWDVIPGAAKVKGEPEVIEDVFGFYFTETAANEENCFIYRMRQVEAKKAVGTGTSISAGEKLYFIVATGVVQNTPVGTPGTNSYFCGWAKRDASDGSNIVLMNFDGTRYDETL
jgi:hypothetical protein